MVSLAGVRVGPNFGVNVTLSGRQLNQLLRAYPCDACGAQPGESCYTMRWNGTRPHAPRPTHPHDSRRRKYRTTLPSMWSSPTGGTPNV
jgi:hypothetical protein